MKRKDKGKQRENYASLDVKKIPVPPESEHIPPPFGCGLMPNHEFTMGFIAPKGSGKTNTIISMLEMYKGYFHKIYIFSPSIRSDCKWDYAKKLKLLIPNTPLKKWIAKLAADQSSNSPIQPMPIDKVFTDMLDSENKFQEEIPEECFYEGDPDEKFFELMEKQEKMVHLLKDHGKLKTFADRILVIFDDQVGSSLFDGSAKKKFKAFNTRHRHFSVSLIMVAQAYKELTKTIRTNFTCLIIFKIGNMKELFVIYEEYQMGLQWKDWLELFFYATEEDFDFLFLNQYGPKELRMRKNFNKPLVFLPKNDEVSRGEVSSMGDIPSSGEGPSKKRKV
jgi:hypothetical protein